VQTYEDALLYGSGERVKLLPSRRDATTVATEDKREKKETADIVSGDWYLSNKARHEMIDMLEYCTDILPLNDFALIAFEDWQMSDEVVTGEMLVQDFLWECTNVTLVALYEWCLNNGHIREVG
jgi:hypothetical protein